MFQRASISLLQIYLGFYSVPHPHPHPPAPPPPPWPHLI